MHQQNIKPTAGDRLIIRDYVVGINHKTNKVIKKKARDERTYIVNVYEDGSISSPTGDVYEIRLLTSTTTNFGHIVSTWVTIK